MAPSIKTLEAKLHAAVKAIFAEDQKSGENTLSVKAVRTRVTKELGLDDDFFVAPEWKAKSKALITEWGQELMDEDEEPAQVKTPPKKKAVVPAKKADPSGKKGTKRAAPAPKPQPKKRQKKEVVSSNSDSDLSDDSEVLSEGNADSSDLGDDTDSEAPKSKRPKGSILSKRAADKFKTVVSHDSEDDEPSGSASEDSDAVSTPPKKNRLKPRKTSHNKSEAKVRLDESEDEPTTSKPSEPIKKQDSETIEAAGNDSDSSEMSVVLDVAPKAKRQRKTKSEVASSKASKSKPKTTKEPKPGKELSPDEAQIKTLQSQLVKCGIRKIWAFELKQYGEDNKAKIRHLGGMLRDAGMVGRYSDARAREIKELRELQADLEAVKEGDSKWGLESKGRRARGAQRKVVDESEEEEEAEDSSQDEKEKPEDKAAKLRDELAFLGDESESD